jgi:hypothetical protein
VRPSHRCTSTRRVPIRLPRVMPVISDQGSTRRHRPCEINASDVRVTPNPRPITCPHTSPVNAMTRNGPRNTDPASGCNSDSAPKPANTTP